MNEPTEFDRIIDDFKSINVMKLDEMQRHLLIRIINQKAEEVKEALKN